MNGLLAYVLSKGYTDKSILGITGALAGKNCTIESYTHENGVNTIIFKWTADDGTTRRTTVEVYDGTPIYVYTPGDTYKYGDLVIYASAFYRCIVSECVATAEIDDTKWNEIGSPDGNYDIVQNESLLPVRFTSADRKMYYAIENEAFYLWDGTQWVKQGTMSQYAEMPTPASIYANRIVQYVGETTTVAPIYINGYFYKCTNESGSYKWENVETFVPELTTQQVNDLIGLLD